MQIVDLLSSEFLLSMRKLNLQPIVFCFVFKNTLIVFRFLYEFLLFLDKNTEAVQSFSTQRDNKQLLGLCNMTY